MMAEDQKAQMDDDSFLDWETRDEAFPFHKHIVAGKLLSSCNSLSLTSCSNLCIGSCAGIMEHVGMFPLDTVKVSGIHR